MSLTDQMLENEGGSNGENGGGLLLGNDRGVGATVTIGNIILRQKETNKTVKIIIRYRE